MKYLLLTTAVVMMLLVGCNGKKGDAAVEQVGETHVTGTDSAQTEHSADTTALPSAVDGSFDDFVYSFMRNSHFQKQRIKFPLTNLVDGKDNPIAAAQWTFDPLYVHKDVYTMLFDDEKAVNGEKDTSIHEVTVEWVYLDQNRVKQYHFAKIDGRWLLVSLDTHSMDKNVNSDFFTFYRSFASNEDYQMKHIKNPFSFATYDSDTFQEIEGVLDVAQWPDFKPEMPAGVITNINYGQHYRKSGYRTLVITSASAGMSCTLSFKKSSGKWMLVRMETI